MRKIYGFFESLTIGALMLAQMVSLTVIYIAGATVLGLFIGVIYGSILAFILKQLSL